MNNYNQRMKQIDEFLKYIRECIEQFYQKNNDPYLYTHPEEYIDEQFICEKLILIGVSDEDKEKICCLPDLKDGKKYGFSSNDDYDLDNYRRKISAFAPVPIGMVKWNEIFPNILSSDRFCYFSFNLENMPYKDKYCKSINIFVPFKSNYLKEGVNILEKHLSERKVKHLTSVSRLYRNDNVMVRVYTPEDAQIVSAFVNSNEYIQNGICKPNPFAIQKDNLAYVYDDSLSYVLVISSLISDYMADKIKNKKLNQISLQNFYDYSINTYNYLIQKSKRNDFAFLSENDQMNNSELNYSKSLCDSMCRDIEYCSVDICSGEKITPGKILKNYLEVIELFLRTFDPKFTYEDYIEFYERVSGNKFNKTTQQNSREKTQNTTSDNNISNYDLLIRILVTMTKKLGVENIDTVFLSLESYLQTGNSVYLINYNNLRNAIDQSNFRDSMNNILNNNMSLSDYLNQLGITEEYIKSKCGSITETKKSKK